MNLSFSPCTYQCTVCVNSVPKCTVNYIFLFFFNKQTKKKEVKLNVMVSQKKKKDSKMI